MRKFLIPIAAAATALTLAAPAAAQWAPPVYRYAPYDFGYNYSGINFARAMLARVERIRIDIRAMRFHRILSHGEARSLDSEARSIERRIIRATRYGVTVGEARRLERRIRQLEYRIAREARDWDGRPGHRYF